MSLEGLLGELLGGLLGGLLEGLLGGSIGRLLGGLLGRLLGGLLGGLLREGREMALTTEARMFLLVGSSISRPHTLRDNTIDLVCKLNCSCRSCCVLVCMNTLVLFFCVCMCMCLCVCGRDTSSFLQKFA